MKQYAYEHFSYGLNEEGFEVWYTTPKQKGKKYRYFDTLEAMEKWCKRNKGHAHIYMGSWQTFEFMAA